MGKAAAQRWCLDCGSAVERRNLRGKMGMPGYYCPVCGWIASRKVRRE
jgi:predicted RNA-binding Zn-ribbon protein involved in translation (DUF1610 family)